MKKKINIYMPLVAWISLSLIIRVCVCVCVCIWRERERETRERDLLPTTHFYSPLYSKNLSNELLSIVILSTPSPCVILLIPFRLSFHTQCSSEIAFVKVILDQHPVNSDGHFSVFMFLDLPEPFHPLNL